jgi:hypothetical protein
MTIYLFDEACASAIASFERRHERKVAYTLQPEKNLELLVSKKLLLIDVFHTFIAPIADDEDQMTYERLGVVAFAKTREPRKGFRDFIAYHHAEEKKLGIHSDAFGYEEMLRMKDHWAFGDSIDRYFDMGYALCLDPHHACDNDSYIKDFGRMMAEFETGKEDTLIIGDGRGEIRPARYFDVDLLLVPDYHVGREFDYNKLIPR